MSYRIEKEQNGVQALVIDGWDKGIGSDPYTGLGRLIQVDLATPGEIAVGYPITVSAQTGGTMTAPIHRTTNIALGSAQAYFILDASSQVFSSSGGATWAFLATNNATAGASRNNQGLAYYKGYLFKFRSNSIDYNPGGSGTWVNAWQTIVSDINHFALVSQDDALYFCNGSGIGSIIEVAGQTFDPANSATYVFNPVALKLPSYDTAQSIAEQGTNLLVGGSLNAIYPWDRLSNSFNYPIFIGDVFIKRMVTVNTNVYIFPGNNTSRGRIYVTNGSQANLYYKIPDYIFGEQDPYFEWGDAIYHRNNLLFGFFVDHNDGSGVINSEEVWAIDLDTKAFRSISSINASSGKAQANVLIPMLTFGKGFGYITAWDNSGGTSGIGYTATKAGVGTANIFTDLIPVGTLFESRTFSQVEFKLRSPLQSGESIQITPYVDSVAGTAFTTTNTVGVLSDVYTVNFEKSQWLQLYISLTGNSATSGVRLKEVRIR